VTVGHITGRARVSRRTFYELFADREACLLAALERIVEMLREELVAAGLGELPWREGVRGGVWWLLSFFEREPLLARVCVVQSLCGGTLVLECRERVLGELARALDAGRLESSRGADCPTVTAEGLVGAALAIVHGRLLRGSPQRLTGLYGELMGLIVLPYLGPAAARREQARPAPAAAVGAAAISDRWVAGGESGDGEGAGDPLADVPMRLTYRTALVLEALARRPGVSNRLAAELAGISDQGQISKLLARLQRLGLAENTGDGHTKGEPNAWSLTALGSKVTQSLRVSTDRERDLA
jgi:AcrR family transcriptional regulator